MSDYRRMTTIELQKSISEGDSGAQAELDRRRDRKPATPRATTMAHTAAVELPEAQLADALRARDSETLERMMELLVDLKTAVSSLEAKIERLIKGDETSEF
jgi:hypothetical protein